MRGCFLLPSILVFIFLIAVSARAETWSFQFSGGAAYNFKLPARIDDPAGGNAIKLDGRFKTRFWDDSPYFAARAGRWEDDHAWELELVHHKLYLENRPFGVQQLDPSLNLATLNRAWKHRGVIYRIGFGAVIARSNDITVGGKTGTGGYRVAGPTAQVAVEKRFYFKKRFFASLEGKITASYAHIPVPGGDANVSNVAVHGLFGFGVRF